MDTSPAKEVKAPPHDGTPRSHDAVILFLFLSVVDDLLPSLRADRRRIFNTFLHLLLRLDASFYILDDLDLFFLDGLLLSYLDLRA